MSDKSVGVFLKPLVRKELDSYVDGYGNSRDWRSYNKSLNVNNFTATPYLKMGTVTFRSLITSEEPRFANDNQFPKHKVQKKGIKRFKPVGTKRHIKYLVTIRFHGLEFRDKESAQFNQKWNFFETEKFSRTIAIDSNTAMIKCQCRDFSLTWEKQLAEKGGLWPNNNWRKYQNLTPAYPIGRAGTKNPNNKMGYCKHIATFLEYLYDSGFIRNK